MTQNPWGEEENAQQASNGHVASQNQSRSGSDTREWRLIEKLVNGLHVEHRRTRRWGIFFKFLTFAYLFALLGIYLYNDTPEIASPASDTHVAVVRVEGAIADGEKANADSLIWSIRKAFENKHSTAVLLRINSPGGSPVQAGYVYDEIKRLREKYPEKKVYAVISDIGASGAYYIAAAADEIYADKASLVGSIGVVSASFGFVDLMGKLGVERRMLTAGEHKGLLDPFTPLQSSEREFWQTILDTTHKQFIEQVRAGRGDRLKENDELFSGLVWTGEQAVDLGLVDGLGSASYVARDVIGVDSLVDYSAKGSPLEQLIDRLGVSMASHLANMVGLGGGVQLR
ncbi:Periplasmic serine protease (ClpP class) [Marinobacterium lacunae]|uniref:Periplasmic serine protease (ClpP class) n=1 Tax=Marinobacterium lacunae TaxID=1232683 RepID=A0A081FTP7_9GAMM|nr:signal peptide peptidase SppA [Marinobacterium lacunae]KEA61902.1 Periplasmic serine protease (ClpP class) [Marinobacterium lacunae]MBR9883854.1 signal peptide peptidase SppA [Oceanospirillales bacterium]